MQVHREIIPPFAIAVAAVLLTCVAAYGQKPENPSLLADAVWFRGESDTSNRTDIYLAVPYSSLQFVKSGSGFAAEYEAVITVRDSVGRKVSQKNLQRHCTAADYDAARGANGAADYSQTVFYLSSGNNSIEIIVTDAIAKRELRAVLTAKIPRYRTQLIAGSGILLVSSIEEHNGRFSITPYLPKNIGRLTEPFFAFFETYNNTSDITEADVVYELTDNKGTLAQRGDRTRRTIKSDVERHYLPIPPQKTLPAGDYTLRIVILKPAEDKATAYKSSDVLAITERPLTIERTAGDAMGKELDKLIRQMLYVASQSEIDNIEGAGSAEEKRRLFDEYWRRLDPSPTTERNEAFDEYYGRIEYANQHFRTFREGWLSDMGAVYVIFGAPISTDRSPAVSASGRSITRWTMANNRQFTFVDDMGFGEYRLATPLPASEKYRYGK